MDFFAFMEEAEEDERFDLTGRKQHLVDAVMAQLALAANEVNEEELGNVAQWVNAVGASRSAIVLRVLL